MAEIRWVEGTIRYPISLWLAPTRRRIPRVLIEPRAKEVGIKVFKEGNYIVFQETDKTAEQLVSTKSEPLRFYAGRYLLPGKVPYHGDLFELFNKGKSITIFFLNNRFYYNIS